MTRRTLCKVFGHLLEARLNQKVQIGIKSVPKSETDND